MPDTSNRLRWKKSSSFRPPSSSPTAPTGMTRAPRSARLFAAFAAPPGYASLRRWRRISTGASRETREISPDTNSSSTKSPSTQMVRCGKAATISSSRVRSTLTSVPRVEPLSVVDSPFFPAGVKQSPQTLRLRPARYHSESTPTTPTRRPNSPAAALARPSLCHDGVPEFPFVAHFHRYRAVPNFERIPARPVEIENVFFGANHPIGLCLEGLHSNFLDVGRNVSVMIWEEFLSHDMKAPCAQIGDECFGVPNSTESEKFLRARLGVFVPRISLPQDTNRLWSRPCVENWRVRIAANCCFDRGSMLAPCDHDDIGSRKARSWLPQ